jgi:hypothetical protein
MTSLVRYARPGSGAAVGLRAGDALVPLADTVAELLRLPLAELRDRCARTSGLGSPEGRALAPLDGRMEVWAAGVTYERSREARMTESEAAPDIYDRVYEAERPELFFKSAAWRVVGPGESISVRADSEIDVPEPELALVINAYGEVVGYTSATMSAPGRSRARTRCTCRRPRSTWAAARSARRSGPPGRFPIRTRCRSGWRSTAAAGSRGRAHPAPAGCATRRAEA